ncbi:MAG: type II secretion system protein, partial [Planctomycetes bacterium]|nr:type II secretion system protein [Planctomycetota bacterium]
MTTRRAFTVIELLVVVSIIALLVGILLPAIGKARDQARVTISQSNLRNLATAHASYGAEFSDRQYTLINDNIAFYGGSTGAAFDGYIDAHGGGSGINNPANHPPVYLGYGQDHDSGVYRMFAYKCERGQVANASLTQPIVFTLGGLGYFGSFRLPNAQQFTQYTNGRFYDPIFYAPKDTEPIRSAQPCLDAPDDFCDLAIVNTNLGDIPAWSSYCLSPAAMFNPEVMRHNDDDDTTSNGWVSPWSLPAGFRSPSFSQAEYPGLKTHMLEHHWLQNNRVDCNPGFQPGTYDGCEPYY